jgi:hypothetical protein
MKGDTFIDRFLLACPFSRGNPTTGPASAYKCTKIVTPVSPLTAYTYFEGATANTTKEILAGDCIGASGDPNGRISAIPGAIFYDRSETINSGCWINKSGTLGSTTAGSVWVRLNTLDDTLASTPTTGISLTYSGPQTGVRDASNTIIPKYDASLYPKGQGWGSLLYSNDAGLPTLNANASALNWTCYSGDFTVNNKTFNKRLLRRKEQIAAYAMSPFLDLNSFDIGNKRPEIAISSGRAETQTGTTYPTGAVDRDCNTTGASGIAYKSPFVAAGNLDLSAGSPTLGKRIYSSYNTYFYSWLPTGSSGLISSDACVTRFGIQDYVGQGNTLLSDVLYCDKTNKFCSFTYKNKGKTSDFISPWDSANRLNWRNAYDYAFFGNTNDTNSTPSRIGIPFIYKENNSSTFYSGTAYGTPFNINDVSTTAATDASGIANFSLALGVPLRCYGNACVYQGAKNDDAYSTLKIVNNSQATEVLVDTIYQELFMVNQSNINTINSEYIQSLVFGHPSFQTSYTSVDTADKGIARRYMLYLATFNQTSVLRARCAQLVEDYK